MILKNLGQILINVVTLIGVLFNYAFTRLNEIQITFKKPQKPHNYEELHNVSIPRDYEEYGDNYPIY